MENLTTISVSMDTKERLAKIKMDNRYKNLEVVIEQLIRRYNQNRQLPY